MYFRENFKLLVYGREMNNILSKPIERSEYADLPRLLDYMLRVMRTANGVGLAAPQIGCFKQFIILQGNDGTIIDLVNPEIISIYGREIDAPEGCLSLPPSGNECIVSRMEIVEVEASSSARPMERKSQTFYRMEARILQHEVDHLTGTFFVDRVSPRERKKALDRFNQWKYERKAQTRMREESKDVNTGFVAACGGAANLS